MHTGLPSVSAWVFRVLSVLRGRAGFPVKSRLLPPQSRHRAPLECCTAAHGTACERSRSAGRFCGDPFVRRVRACRSPRPRSGCRARRVRSWAPQRMFVQKRVCFLKGVPHKQYVASTNPRRCIKGLVLSSPVCGFSMAQSRGAR